MFIIIFQNILLRFNDHYKRRKENSRKYQKYKNKRVEDVTRKFLGFELFVLDRCSEF